MPPTYRQRLGSLGERAVASLSCPRCKRERALKRLPPNFKCADIICDFCGYLAQVKTTQRENIDRLPSSLLGAAWGPQVERMTAGIYFPLYIVVVNPNRRERAIYYLPADFQSPQMFQQRKALGPTARRAGWTGYQLRLDLAQHPPVRLA